jgi:RNA polymerase sigma factor (sigma-70 family)
LLYPGPRGLKEPKMFIPMLQKELSIDDYVDHEEECRLGTLLADPASDSQEEKLYTKEVSYLVQTALVNLDERELHIIRNRFGLLGGNEQTLEEIGKTLNLSRERVRQLEREAKDKLRATLIPYRGNLRFSLA